MAGEARQKWVLGLWVAVAANCLAVGVVYHAASAKQ